VAFPFRIGWVTRLRTETLRGIIPIQSFFFGWSDDVISFKELMQGYMHFFIAQVVRAANQLQQFKSQPP